MWLPTTLLPLPPIAVMAALPGMAPLTSPKLAPFDRADRGDVGCRADHVCHVADDSRGPAACEADRVATGRRGRAARAIETRVAIPRRTERRWKRHRHRETDAKAVALPRRPTAANSRRSAEAVEARLPRRQREGVTATETARRSTGQQRRKSDAEALALPGWLTAAGAWRAAEGVGARLAREARCNGGGEPAEDRKAVEMPAGPQDRCERGCAVGVADRGRGVAWRRGS
jgi:hypothetical protein